MFQSTQRVLEATEAHILNLPSENSLWSIATRYMIFPFKYLLLGLKEFLKPAQFWAFLTFALLIGGTIAIKNTNIPSEYTNIILNICIYAPMVLVIFAVPSTYAYSGVKIEYVNTVVIYIKKEGLNSIEKVELLEENIDKIYSRISSRVTFYKWLIGASWAIYMLFFNLEIRFLMSDKVSAFNQAMASSLLSFSYALTSAIGAMILVVGYKRASEILIKSIEFGCVQHKYTLLENA